MKLPRFVKTRTFIWCNIVSMAITFAYFFRDVASWAESGFDFALGTVAVAWPTILMLVLLGAVIMGLSVIIAAFWTEFAILPRGLYGAWKNIKVTALGKVTIRHASYYIDGKGRGSFREETMVSERCRKGKPHQIQFTVPSYSDIAFVIEVPVLYKLIFSHPTGWNWEETLSDGRCRYKATLTRDRVVKTLGSAQSSGLMNKPSELLVTFVVVTRLRGDAGWGALRRELGFPWLLIAKRGEAVATAPDVQGKYPWDKESE